MNFTAFSDLIASAIEQDACVAIDYTGRDGKISTGRLVRPLYFLDDNPGVFKAMDIVKGEPRNFVLTRLGDVRAVTIDPSVPTAEQTDALSTEMASVELMLTLLGPVQITAGDHGVTLNWARTTSGVSMTVTKPTLAEALKAAASA